jgi:Fe-S-cluster containining protein
MKPAKRWRDDPARTALMALYAKADALVAGASCACTPSGAGEGAPREEVAPCCHFALTGREPYPTAVELAEVEHAVRARGIARPAKRKLPVVDALRACPLLSDAGRCTIYTSRPFGCRTFFCQRGEGLPKHTRATLDELSKDIAALSARAFPRDPRPRPLVRALAQRTLEKHTR